jgi:hypothetical protein
MVTRSELHQPLRQLWFSATRARRRNERVYEHNGLEVSSTIAKGAQLAQERGKRLLDLAAQWEDRSISLHDRLGLYEQVQATLMHPEVDTAMQLIMRRIDEKGEEYALALVNQERKHVEEYKKFHPDKITDLETFVVAVSADIAENGIGKVVLIPTSQGGMLIREAAGTYKIMPGRKQDIDVLAFFSKNDYWKDRLISQAVSQIMEDMFANEHTVNPNFPDGFSKDDHNVVVPDVNPGSGLTSDNRRLAQAIKDPGYRLTRSIGTYFMHGYPEEVMHRERERILHALYLSYKKDPVKWQKVIDEIIENYQKAPDNGDLFDIDLVKTKYLRWDNYHNLYDKRMNDISHQLLSIRSQMLRELLEQTATEDVYQKKRRR